ncbi:unnamed protein product [Moneuplotes crassus]|uniref:Uncharacterized protein n=1 Tax=Euplotes crassus TaxID=5936 RepID=A0AAD1UJQ2_EUPCR|nr:unnamed protein product [Moneuplotes crassus]
MCSCFCRFSTRVLSLVTSDISEKYFFLKSARVGQENDEISSCLASLRFCWFNDLHSLSIPKNFKAFSLSFYSFSSNKLSSPSGQMFLKINCW